MDTGFGDGNFRLLVDGVPRAPTSNLNDSVDPHSAKEGTIVFAFPVTARRLVLQVRMGNDVVEIPVDLTATTPTPVPIASPAQVAQFDAATSPIALHAGQEARLKDHRATCVYKVLAAQVDRSRPDTLSLSVTVQVTSEGPIDTGFGDSNFRLLVDDVPRAPTNRLIDSVDPHSAKEGTIVFAFPATTRRLVLQLRLGEEVAEFPVDLSPIQL
jgi:nucleoside diphosphate kinase